jgi:hypothetical protein
MTYNDQFTLSLIRPGGVGAEIPVWAPRIPRGQPGAKPVYDLNAWQVYLNGWRILRPMRIRLTMKSNGAEGIMVLDARMHEARELIEGFPSPKQTPSQILLSVEVMLPTDAPCAATDEWVRAHLRWLLLHELDEFIEVNGVRRFDPHRDGRTPHPGNS